VDNDSPSTLKRGLKKMPLREKKAGLGPALTEPRKPKGVAPKRGKIKGGGEKQKEEGTADFVSQNGGEVQKAERPTPRI